VGEHVEIGSGTTVGSHVVLAGRTRIGGNNHIYPFACLGEVPQDKKYNGEPSRLEIGDHNTIREYSTINIGTAQGEGVTKVGDHNWIMAYSHIAHDCEIGNNVVLANACQLAGHVLIGDHVILGGGTLVHQFCRIGAHAFTAGGSVVLRDVPPYVMAGGNSAQPHGINSEGLKRRGFSGEDIEIIRRAYKTLYRTKLTFEEAKQLISEQAKSARQLEILSAFLTSTQRGVIR
ncbi:MAG TPA: acyl-ACP--UDP-N-acetylglucosamine O-acyltransferase, partial [Burkholderiales bacterium]|nr:acyl-ACP--UDP-N-acetylglucosamine O-acyltransferase [Burkholderiales bacterium]